MYEISLFPAGGASNSRLATGRMVGITTENLAHNILTNSWSPGLYKDGVRAIANLERIELLALDIDGDCDLPHALKLFSKYKHVIGTSRNHQKEKNGVTCDRFRVVLFLEQPATSDAEFKEYWFAAFAKWPFIDQACKDSARFFFPCKEIVSVNEDGALWSEKVNYSLPKPKLKETIVNKSRGKLSKATKDFLIDGADTPPGQWHPKLFKACTDFNEQGFDIDDARRKLEAITGEWHDTDEKTLVDVYENRTPKYEPRGATAPSSKLRELVLRSKYVINMADPLESVLVEESTGVTLDIRQTVVQAVISSKNDQALFNANNVIYAQFDYDRFKYSPLFMDKSGVHVYNAYIPPTWQHEFFYFGTPLPQATTIPQIYDDFLTHLTAGNDESKSYIIDWLATAMQSRNYTILTALGEPGIGKGVLGVIMEALFGEHNFVRTRDEIFKNKFNGQLRNKVLVYIDEVALKSAEDHNRLKDIVNDKIEIERKGQDAAYVKNFASYYLSSNHMDAVKPEAGDRRFSIIQLTDKKLGETPLIGRIEEMRSAMSIASLATYLLGHKVTRDMLVPFVSERSSDVKEAGLADWEAFVVFDWTSDKVGKNFELKALQDDIVARFGSFRSPPGRRRIDELAKKYPEYLKIQRKGPETSERLIYVINSPTANVVKLKGWPSLTGKGS